MRAVMVMHRLVRLGCRRRCVRMVMLAVIVPVAVLMVVSMVRAVFTTYAEFCGRETGPYHALGPDDVPLNREAAQRPSDRGERHTRVDERTQDHVAGCTRETVEIERTQSRPSYPARDCILPDSISE